MRINVATFLDIIGISCRHVIFVEARRTHTYVATRRIISTRRRLSHDNRDRKGEHHLARNLYSWVPEWENETILIHLVDDRKHQVDRARRIKGAYNREYRAGCAKIHPPNGECNVVSELPEIPRCICITETRGIEFPPCPPKCRLQALSSFAFFSPHTSEFLNPCGPSATTRRLSAHETRKKNG